MGAAANIAQSTVAQFIDREISRHGSHISRSARCFEDSGSRAKLNTKLEGGS